MKIQNEMQRKPVRRTISLDDAVNRDLDLYARLIDSSPNYVVNQILAMFFDKDKDFQDRKNENSSPGSLKNTDGGRKNSQAAGPNV